MTEKEIELPLQRHKLGELEMLRAFVTIAAVVAFNAAAWASCPPGTRYNCSTAFNGKQSCGCR
ncbi:hypothetical protein [uncultured Bosea sp.]|uniref:hypothetical protein n=1 Tax=uncultured Bosea sp. TaxID=211457 RepID=UPI00263A646E|nr:hypothetical protein [uncultured Bosea sp.]